MELPFYMRGEEPPVPEGQYYCINCGSTDQPHSRLQVNPKWKPRSNQPPAVFYAVCKQCFYVYIVDLSDHLPKKERQKIH